MKHGNEYFCRMQACLTQDELNAELAHHTAG